MANEDYVIRHAETSDIHQVMRINQVTLPENYPYPFFIEILKKYPRSFIVAEKDGEIAGYMMNRIEKGLPGVFNTKFHRVTKGHVVSIAVLPEHRKRGLGKRLMLEGMKAMKDYGAEEFVLEVRITNEAALAMYKSLGFTVERELRGYYHDGESAYLMSKKAEDI
ncbi:MAG: GNAT family N-acetyltransferase [Candidatus Jordarchaeum sp.]|uniref:GNAT family N-acetyltransferase n=1 Tax=Candidatus Jordarchaeum sp. TaxID=2823881 RepID=UPI0040491332